MTYPIGFPKSSGVMTRGYFGENEMIGALAKNKKIAILSLWIVASSLISTPSASAASGDLDATFGTGGKVITDFGANDVLNSSVLQSDGKIVVAGSSNNNFAIARYTTSGVLDSSFDTDGANPVDFGSTDAAYAVAVQSDGKIVAAGASGGNFALARVNSNGPWDTTFDSDGRVTTDLLSIDEAYAIAIQSDGKIVLAGKSNDDFAVARYNSDGSLDTSFNALGAIPGTLTTDFGSAEEIRSIAIQSDGKIVVAGSSGVFTPDVAVARYNTNGTPDTSFDGDGKVTVDFNGDADWANSVSIQSDGKIVVGGAASSPSGDSDFGLIRLTSTGGLDSTFDSDGKVKMNIFNTDVISTILILDNGKILAAGYSFPATKYNVTLARYNTSGSLDTSFGTEGIVTTSMSEGDSYAMSALIQSDGKIVVSGYVITTPNNDFFLNRYAHSAEPTAPTLNSVVGGDKRVTASFTARANNGAAITDYEYSLNGGAYTSVGTTTSPFTITGLSGRTAYSVTIKARNSVGLSTASSSLSATTTDSTLDASEAAAEAARVAAAAAEAAKKAKEQKELLEILSIIPEIGKLALSVGDTALAVSGQKCVKNKTIKYVKKGAKCPKGYVKKK
jgi:uncharacterized delta-60 repeat protein